MRKSFTLRVLASTATSLSAVACLVILNLVLSANFAWAETGDELRAAYQREFAYLVSLREGLRKQTQEIEARLAKRAVELEREVKAEQTSLAVLAAATDAKVDDAADLEKRLRSGGGATAFESSLRDARSTIQTMQARAEGRLPERKVLKASADVDGFESFLKIISTGLDLVATLSKPRAVPASFVGPDGEVIQASVLHWGGVAAFGLWSDKVYVLAPDGKGRLKAIAEDKVNAARAFERGSTSKEPAPLVAAYFYENLSERAELIGGANLAERAAGAMPVVYLILIALAVGGLFAGLART